MPRVIFTERTLRDLQRLRDFLKDKAPVAAKRAGITIKSSIKQLEQQPLIAPPAQDMPELYRDLTIDFGDSGFVVRYHYDGGDILAVVAIKHQKEVGFQTA